MKNRGRAYKAEQIERYLREVARPAPKHGEPNDRHYSRDVERKLRHMSPLELDALLRSDDKPAIDAADSFGE